MSNFDTIILKDIYINLSTDSIKFYFKLTYNDEMKKLLVLLFSVLFSLNSYAEVPTHIGGNTIKNICDVSGCSEGISAYSKIISIWRKYDEVCKFEFSR